MFFSNFQKLFKMKYSLLCFSILFCFCQIEATKECIKDGLFCESCHSLVHCTQNSDGSFDKTSRQSCGLKKCLNGACTDDAEPICDGIADLEFPCKDVGIFPHPFYCNKYVLCVDNWGLKPYVAQCEEGYGYNIKTKNCDVKLTKNQCKELTYPVPACTEVLQNAPLANDNTIYYSCERINKSLFEKVLYPVLRRCPHGEKYDAVNLCH